jgi:hypothetical protein
MISFIKFHLEQQVFRRWRAIMSLVRRTNSKRWSTVAKEVPHWDARNQRIATLIPPGSSLVDVGAGAQTMRKHVKGLTRYTPCDLFQNTPDTHLCDFNSGVIPQGIEQHDYSLSSGVFEYVREPGPFFDFLKRVGKTVILSYNVKLPQDSLVDRLACDWINHHNMEEFQRLLAEQGLKPVQQIQHNEREWIFVLERTK